MATMILAFTVGMLLIGQLVLMWQARRQGRRSAGVASIVRRGRVAAAQASGQADLDRAGSGSPASAASSAALSVRSHGRSRSGRPKWPYAAVWR